MKKQDDMEPVEYPQMEEENLSLNEPAMTQRRRRTARKGLTPTQLNLLKIFAYDDSEETAREIQQVVFQHLQKRMDEELDRLWDEGILDQKRLDELRKMHIRDILK